MSSVANRLRIESLTPLHSGSMLLALVIAVVHLFVGIGIVPSAPEPLLSLAAVVFLGGLLPALFDFRPRRVRTAPVDRRPCRTPVS